MFKKKAHPTNQMSSLILLINILKTLSLTYLSRNCGMELAPFPSTLDWIGCQGFIGPLPSAFLDKSPDPSTILRINGIKRTAAKITGKHLSYQRLIVKIHENIC